MTSDIVALERAEIEAIYDLYRSAHPEAVAAAGLTFEDLGVARLTAASKIDVLALNRVIGLGLDAAPAAADLDAILARLSAIGSPRFFIPVAPIPGADAVERLLETRGLRHYNNWMRLRRDVAADVPDDARPSSVEVRVIDAGDAGIFSAIVTEAFQYPATIAALPGQPVGRPQWTHYLAYHAGSPIGCAAMFVAGEAAWFGFAATLPEARGRGAQSALVRRRLADARAAGCRWVSVETAEQTATRDAPSFRNLSRLGFEVAYRRPNYLWERP